MDLSPLLSDEYVFAIDIEVDDIQLVDFPLDAGQIDGYFQF